MSSCVLLHCPTSSHAFETSSSLPSYGTSSIPAGHALPVGTPRFEIEIACMSSVPLSSTSPTPSLTVSWTGTSESSPPGPLACVAEAADGPQGTSSCSNLAPPMLGATESSDSTRKGRVTDRQVPIGNPRISRRRYVEIVAPGLTMDYLLNPANIVTDMHWHLFAHMQDDGFELASTIQSVPASDALSMDLIFDYERYAEEKTKDEDDIYRSERKDKSQE